MKSISSPHNPLIKHIVKLQDRAYRTEQNQCIAEGIRVCQTMYEAGLTMHYLIYTQVMEDQLHLFADVEQISISSDLMHKISSSTTPSGIVGIFGIPPAPKEDIMPGLVAADLTNPGNMGTLIRTAAALGAPSVVVVQGCDPWSPKVIQASAGAIALVRLHTIPWSVLLAKKKDIPLCALVVSGGIAPTKNMLVDSLLVIGNEAHGIPVEWLADCTSHITLPMPGGTESLNAAIAGSIALYLGYAQKVL